MNLNDHYERYDKMHKHYMRKRTVETWAVTVAAVSLVGIAYAGLKDVPVSVPATNDGQLDCRTCHSKKAAMIEYFKKAGSKSPEKMAEAVMSTKSPSLLAAIARVESDGNADIRKTGYKKQHDGAWQVNRYLHGKVPSDPVKQALQAEAILKELTETLPLKKALSVYGGDSSNQYQKTILAELERTP